MRAEPARNTSAALGLFVPRRPPRSGRPQIARLSNPRKVTALTPATLAEFQLFSEPSTVVVSAPDPAPNRESSEPRSPGSGVPHTDSPHDPFVGIAPELVHQVYEQCHRLAVRYMGGERPSHTLSPTALVNEAFLR